MEYKMLSHSPSIVTSGLVLYLDAANSRSYPGSGTSWFDLSGNGNNGTLTNGPTFNSGNGGSIVFDGSNDYCRILLPNTIICDTLTYDCWINNSGLNGYKTIIDQDNDDWFFGLLNQELVLYDPNIFTGVTILPNVWYNVSVSHQVNQPCFFYINGNLIFTSGNNNTTHTTSRIGIGAGLSTTTTGDEFWPGNISVCRFYNRALTAQEIQQNFNATRGRFGI